MPGELLALFAGLCFACGSLFARAGSDQVEHKLGLDISLSANALVILVLAGAYTTLTGMPDLSWPGILAFGLGGVAGTLLGRWASIGSLHRLGPSRAALYRNGQPVLTTVLAVALLREEFAPVDLIGGGLVMAGILASSYERVRPAGTTEGSWHVLEGQRARGIALGLLSALGFAVGNTLRKVGVDLWPEPILGATVGILVALGASLARGGGRELRLPRRQLHRGHAYFAAFGLCNAAAQLLFFWSLLDTQLWLANLFVSAEPLLTVALSAALFRGRESLGAATVGSAVLVVAGSIAIVAL